MSAALGWLAMAFWALGAEPVLPTVGCLFIRQTVLAGQTDNCALPPAHTNSCFRACVFQSIPFLSDSVLTMELKQALTCPPYGSAGHSAALSLSVSEQTTDALHGPSLTTRGKEAITV